MWVRTCQECGHRQGAERPVYGVGPPVSYCNAKCGRCKSEALDYGSANFEFNEAGKLVKIPASDEGTES